ncbi:hypothetical protein P8C59_008146 [Phyllachora maydis]|uniref:SPRY domain-containing protein n=1 Tax=Phyllachora maydis TaxID=1825666 RepID=A0AAD9MEA3_9PEZI|nr:hypothetical protein P8C59_008146 [Phyllachora maydis]
MCFLGNKNHDEMAPRPAPGQAPQQPSSIVQSNNPYAQKLQLQRDPTAAHPPPVRPSAQDDYCAPPPGPPPGRCHDSGSGEPAWAVHVPDTALFPPPPAFFSAWDRSPASNATEREAEQGEAWCRQHRLAGPADLDASARARRSRHAYQLLAPAGLTGKQVFARAGDGGVWELHTPSASGDYCVVAYPPAYAVAEDSPMRTKRAATAYFEVVLRGRLSDRASVSLGYVALPYPCFRQPGWHRGSLAVHADDGHRFVNDRWGGKDFTAPFQTGQTVGLGVTFRVGDEGRIEGRVFFTRDGRLDGEWDVNEELDTTTDRGVEGLQGYHDLSFAVGTWGGVRVEVVFDPTRWKYRDVSVA